MAKSLQQHGPHVLQLIYMPHTPLLYINIKLFVARTPNLCNRELNATRQTTKKNTRPKKMGILRQKM